MARFHQDQTTTKHTCGAPVFGRKTPGCPRCDELIAGAEPVRWNNRSGVFGVVNGYVRELTKDEALAHRLAAIRAHDCRKSHCGPVCTAFDW